MTFKSKTSEDIKDLSLAEGVLSDGETALNKDQHATAATLLENSIRHSQAILKRHQANKNSASSIKFRY